MLNQNEHVKTQNQQEEIYFTLPINQSASKKKEDSLPINFNPIKAIEELCADPESAKGNKKISNISINEL
jgi:hypothetical protein